MFELSPKDFNKHSENLSSKFSNKITIVKFYTPRCGYCVKSQPDYEKLDKIAGDDFNIAQLNCQEYPELTELINGSSVFGYKVLGFPTYIIFVNSIFFKYYEGDRSTRDLLNTLINLKTSTR